MLFKTKNLLVKLNYSIEFEHKYLKNYSRS